jgi:uncharacterized protein YyaL (SSP411 family)
MTGTMDEQGERGPAAGEARRPNRLIHEKSPYLLQHADNPVDWRPWGEEAFEEARRADRPVFLSIGYATCHWCHVMAHESFQDPEVARLLNETFVPVKVDREERPDVDAAYMTVCQIMTGGGGWPLTVILTPDKKPFFAGTYFPRESRGGRIGMVELIGHLAAAWRKRRGEVMLEADRMALLAGKVSAAAPGGRLEAPVIDAACRNLARDFDETHGGFGGAPKFPMPTTLLFLLRAWRRTGWSRALEMAETTLGAMRAGGIFDHVGFGFHRYATDAAWIVPHFEKMLYDQALLAMAYVEAFQATGKAAYRSTAEEIFRYVLDRLTVGGGAFASAEDADSEGGEGAYYAWTPGELREALGEEAALVGRVFNVSAEGKVVDPATGERGRGGILHRTRPAAELARELGIGEQALAERLEAARLKLLDARQRRAAPPRDDKVLADWNGLMIAALAMGARILGVPAHAEAARRAASFVLTAMRPGGGRLMHRYRDGEAAIPAFARDHAFLVWGLLELHEATRDAAWLAEAVRLNDELIGRFADADGGGFFETAADVEPVLARRKEGVDGAVPSANSAALCNLLRLGRITGRADLPREAGRIETAFSATVERIPEGFTLMLAGLDFPSSPPG